MYTKLVRKSLALTIICLLTVAASPLVAEEPLGNSEYSYCCRGNHSSWSRGQYYRRFDRHKIETLNGEVVSVDAYPSRRGTSQGIHLMVNTGQETVEVHLAPSWYLKDREFEITPKDKIVITGSRIIVDGKPAIIASQIEKGDRTLLLRDEDGFPMWRGWRQ